MVLIGAMFGWVVFSGGENKSDDKPTDGN